MLWYICDEFGFGWGDGYDSLEDAKAGLERLREDPKIKEWGIELEVAIYSKGEYTALILLDVERLK